MYIRKVKKSESKSQLSKSVIKLTSKVVYIRKFKKSESKSQPVNLGYRHPLWLCISVKLKNLKANHNLSCEHRSDCAEIIGIIANIPLYNFEHNRNIAIFAAPNNTQYEV